MHPCCCSLLLKCLQIEACALPTLQTVQVYTQGFAVALRHSLVHQTILLDPFVCPEGEKLGFKTDKVPVYSNV